MYLMKRVNFIRPFLVFTLLSMAMLSMGCSTDDSEEGGGGGTPLSYAGNTDPAAISETNAKNILASANPSVASGVASSFIGAAQIDTINSSAISQTVSTLQSIVEIIEQDALSSASDQVFMGAVLHTDTQYCSEGGTITTTITDATQSGAQVEIKGTIALENCTEGGVTTSGTLNYTGQGTLTSSEDFELESLAMSFTNWTLTSTQESITTSGNMTVSGSGNTTNMTINMVVDDKNSDKTAWIKDYTVTETQGSGYIDQNFSGQYYDSEYGYATVSTPTPFRIMSGSSYPSAGVMLAVGAEGSAGGSTKARLTASSTGYIIEADTNGDGTYDYNSGELSWDTY